MERRITPDNIEQLEKDSIFVFGSNESGIHGAGAALTAKTKFGAKEGIGFGPQGQSFAVPTKSWLVDGSLNLPTIDFYLQRMMTYIIRNPDKKFYITKIGCGLAGYSIEDIAPLLFRFTVIPNVYLPKEVWDLIEKANDPYEELKIDFQDERNEV